MTQRRILLDAQLNGARAVVLLAICKARHAQTWTLPAFYSDRREVVRIALVSLVPLFVVSARRCSARLNVSRQYAEI